MKWYRINDYAITNGQEFSGPKDAYKHGTHIISKAIVGGEPRYTLWEGERMVGIFRTADEAKERAEATVEKEVCDAGS
jgi:hypothetical protein